MSLLDRVKMLCQQRGVSINRFEKEAGLTRGSVAKWDDHEPSGQKLQKAADYFGVSVNYLLTGQSGLVATVQPFQPGDDVTETYDEYGNTAGGIKKAPAAEAEDAQLAMFFEDLRRREDIRKLFEIAHTSTPEEVQQAAKIMEALRKE